MKKKMLKLLAAFISLVVLASCSQEDFTTFGGEKSGVYIQSVATTDINGTPLSYTDSLVFTFSSYGSDVTTHTDYVPVKIMGDTAGVDRKFILAIDESQTTAQQGVDYEFSETDCFIPAGKTRKNVPFILKRTSNIDGKDLRIVFKLQPNENFSVELEQYNNATDYSASSQKLNGSQFKVIFNDSYNKTDWWEFYGDSYYGTWSTKKEKLLNDIMGWKHSDWENWKVPYGQMAFAAKQLRKYLQNAADAGEPVRENDGSFMQLPAPNEVDYSRYTNE